MATMEKRVRGDVVTWRVRYRDPHEPNPKAITVPDEKSARALVGDIERWGILNPGLPYPRHGIGKELPPALAWDAAVAWLQDAARTKAPRTIERYSVEMEPFLEEIGGAGAKLTAFTSSAMEAYDSKLAKLGRAPATRRGVLITLDVFRRWAAARSDQWPGLPAIREVTRPKAIRPAVRAPTWAETDAMLERLDRRGSAYRTAMIARCTGLRAHQIAALRWTHIDLDRAILRVPVGKTVAETAMRREVPIWAGVVKQAGIKAQ